MRPTIVVCLLALVVAGALAAGSGPAGASSSGCVNLAVTPGIKPALNLAYRNLHGPKHTVAGPLAGTTYYGRCGSTHWAIGDFVQDGKTLGDQPETFRRLAGHIWHDRGDDGSICNVPARLRRLWGAHGPPC